MWPLKSLFAGFLNKLSVDITGYLIKNNGFPGRGRGWSGLKNIAIGIIKCHPKGASTSSVLSGSDSFNRYRQSGLVILSAHRNPHWFSHWGFSFGHCCQYRHCLKNKPPSLSLSVVKKTNNDKDLRIMITYVCRIPADINTVLYGCRSSACPGNPPTPATSACAHPGSWCGCRLCRLHP